MSLHCIVPDAIWHAQQPLKFGPIQLTTRMTVVRLRDGSLWVHSPISPTSELNDELAAIGDVRHVIASNKSHHPFLLPFLAANPAAKGYVAVGLESKRQDLAGFTTIPREAPWSEEASMLPRGVTSVPVSHDQGPPYCRSTAVRRLIVSAFASLDGIVQAPSRAERAGAGPTQDDCE